MKKFSYKFLSAKVNHGTEENPDIEQIFLEKIVSSEELAKQEAYNGKYTIEDDGRPEPDTTTTDDVLNALLGVTV